MRLETIGLFNFKQTRLGVIASVTGSLVWGAVVLGALAFGLLGCAQVKQRDRGFLADPIMQRNPDALENQLETHNLPRREGSAGGNAGSGGGCGR